MDTTETAAPGSEDPRMFADPPAFAGAHRRAITQATRIPEPQALAPLLDAARLPADASQRAEALARRLAAGVREAAASGGRERLVQSLLQEYALSSQEGVALMCVAEALLRIPDDATRDALIRDKIAHGRWQEHLWRSPSLFVNAASWGLLITGRLVSVHSEQGLSGGLARLIARGGEPLVRKGVDLAMRMMGEHFVTGRTIGEALARAQPRQAQGFRYSFDMLGEAASTAADAQRYLRAYETAIDAIGRASAGRGFVDGPGISIKLSALHPRYSRAQQARVVGELYPALLRLARSACGYGMGLNIDAEEADRLELSLELLERLCFEPTLAGWNGLGFVVQAYQKRCPRVIEHLVDLARRSGRRLMVRLVKGAYWDGEIKRAQVDGQPDYPVYTRKTHTDVAYVACARLLLAAPDAVYPQFATHNARTLATIHELADPAAWHPGQYEFQCLHGMGEPLYEQVVAPVEDGGLARPCRIYAPVGTHETLLAYLVRRLLENGANTSFVNRIADPSVPIGTLVRDPVDEVLAQAAGGGPVGAPHPAIPLPPALYGTARENSQGLDLADERCLERIGEALARLAASPVRASPPPGAAGRCDDDACAHDWLPVTDPADRRERIGAVREATLDEVDRALERAAGTARAWADTPPAERAAALARGADALQAAMPELSALLIREAGKTASNAVSEVREAIDFLRYYGGIVREDFEAATHVPLGPVACISPWNFPLAIFVGQLAAALAAGNVVLAKPAEQTPLIAARAVAMLHAAGVPGDALQLLPGRGEVVGARLVADPRVQGVLFTGSTEVARILQRTIAQRPDAGLQPIPLIAETGGQNAMIVDSSALPEQVVADVVGSAFDSAGQRCSALRVLCVQDEAYDRIREMLVGAMAQLSVGRTDRLSNDVGPVIDEDARATIEAHVAAMRARGRRIERPAIGDDSALAHGSFVAPTLIEIESIAELEREVFGPVLHLLGFRREALGALLEDIRATGYGLTLGVHSRIDETIATVVAGARVGNVYVNRNMVGAVVGVQPFGGEGLSGTGPKAGGPLYLYRLLRRVPADVLVRIAPAGKHEATVAELAVLAQWAGQRGLPRVVDACARFDAHAGRRAEALLAGPTGERNVYRTIARDAVLCLAGDDTARLVQLAATLAVDGRALWPASASALHEALPPEVRERVALVAGADPVAAQFDAVLFDGDDDAYARLRRLLAERPGPIVGATRPAAQADDWPLERLVVERVLSVNTAAAGGNASLMTLE